MAARSRPPLVLAGPIVRYVDDTKACVWVATSSRTAVHVDVLDPSGVVVASSSTVNTTTMLGDNLYVALVVAVPTPSTTRLQASTVYRYRLTFGAIDFATAMGGPAALANICYPPDTLPSFVLPPKTLSQVRLVHASCRKAHGEGLDALPLLDGQLAAARSGSTTDQAFALARPHQLFLTGDQIYADDLAGAWLAMCIDAGGWLLGSRTEPVPALAGPDPRHPDQGLPFGLTPGGPGTGMAWPMEAGLWPFGVAGQPWKGVFPTVGVRGLPAKRAGLTSDSPNSSKLENIAAEWDYRKVAQMTARNHMMLFGEFCAAFLLSWSPVLWCPGDPSGPAPVLPLTPPPPWDESADAIAQFGFGIKAVRRALANIATYMICDDHEVTDDWFMNRMWCERVLGVDDDTLGRRVIRNALIAYAVFEAWGNTPEQFGPNTPGQTLLSLLDQGQHMNIQPGSQSREELPFENSKDQVGLLVGMPAPLGKSDQRLQRASRALTWHYRWGPATWPYEVISLDCRTARRYLPGPVDPPQLLDDGVRPAGATGPSSDEFAAQLGAARAPDGIVTLVIAQTPVLGVRPIEAIQSIPSVRVAFAADAEAWALSNNGYQLMLARLAAHNPTTIVLSGDVHYSFVAVADYFASHAWGETTARQFSARIVQLNSSALKNEASNTRTLQERSTAALSWPFDKNPRAWIGFGTPQRLLYTPPPTGQYVPPPPTQILLNETPILIALDEYGLSYANPSGGPLPTGDWMYRIEFLTGTKVPSLATGQVAPIDTYPPDQPSRVAEFTQWLQNLAKNQRAAIGATIIGLNNISTITFSGATPGVRHVKQEVAWRATSVTSLTTPLATTTFDVPLQTGPPPQIATGI